MSLGEEKMWRVSKIVGDNIQGELAFTLTLGGEELWAPLDPLVFIPNLILARQELQRRGVRPKHNYIMMDCCRTGRLTWYM